MSRLFVYCALAILSTTGIYAEKADDAGLVRFVRVPHAGIQPQALVDGKGTIHLLYFAGDPKQGDLFYVHSSDDGATFSEPIRVNSQPGSAIAMGTIRGGQIALGRNNRVHVAWNGSGIAVPEGPLNPEAGKTGMPMLYTRMNDTGTAFEPQRNLMKDTFGLDGGGSVAADASGNVYVAWHGKGKDAVKGEAGRQVWILRSSDDGITFTPEAPAWSQSTGVCGCCGLGLFASRSGSLFGLYRSATENTHRDIYLLTSPDRGRSFTGRMMHKWDINACPMSSMGFAESAGTVLGAWETGGQVYYSSLAAQPSEPISAPGDGKNRKHPRLSSNGKQTLLVWTEGTGWQRGGSLAWQLFDAGGKPTAISGMKPGTPVWSFAATVKGRDKTFLIFY